jgi:hypothetical protein
MLNRIALGIVVMVLTAVEGVAQTPPPPGNPTTLAIYESAGGGCTLSVTPDQTVRFGEQILMKNNSSDPGTIYQRDGFWNVQLAVGAERGTVTMHSAGTYLSACVPGQWKAPLRLRPKAPASPTGNSFIVAWADQGAPSTWRYGVQYRIGQGAWRAWRSGTSQRAATFQGQNGRTYFFRARTIRPSANKRTDWSPARRVVT